MPPSKAYLVIREGAKWTDVFHLVPGQTATIGRAPTNQIVMKDDRCSRCHAEVYFLDDHWYVRDLESRNGTLLGETPIRSDQLLNPGDVIRIGNSQLAFVYDLTKAFPESNPTIRTLPLVPTMPVGSLSDSDSDLNIHEPTMITHRRMQTKFLDPDKEDQETIPKVGRAAA